MKFKGIKKRFFVIGIILVLIVASSISILGKSKPAEVKQDIKNVKVEKLKTGSISANVEYPSNLKPAKNLVVVPKAGGRVASVNVNVGDKVTAGQVLFTIETTGLMAQLQQQQANLAMASAGLEKVSDSGYVQQLLQQEQVVSKLQIQMSSMKDSYDRVQKLYAAGISSKKDLDDMKTQYDGLTVDLKTAQDNLNLLKDKSGPQSTRAAAAQVDQAQAGVNSVQIQINDASVTSPISGVVSAKDVEVGQIAGGQSGSVTVIDSGSLNAEINVPDKMLAQLQVGQSIPVTINALGDKKITGVIDSISPNTNDKNNFYTIKIKVDNSNGDIKAGLFAKVSLPSEKRSNVLLISNECIKMENGVNYLYTVEKGVVKKISVETGISDEKNTEVSGKNIKEGMEIITEGQNLLSENEKVNVLK